MHYVQYTSSFGRGTLKQTHGLLTWQSYLQEGFSFNQKSPIDLQRDIFYVIRLFSNDNIQFMTMK